MSRVILKKSINTVYLTRTLVGHVKAFISSIGVTRVTVSIPWAITLIAITITGVTYTRRPIVLDRASYIAHIVQQEEGVNTGSAVCRCALTFRAG